MEYHTILSGIERSNSTYLLYELASRDSGSVLKLMCGKNASPVQISLYNDSGFRLDRILTERSNICLECLQPGNYRLVFDRRTVLRFSLSQ